jgi:hypothetical protein
VGRVQVKKRRREEEERRVPVSLTAWMWNYETNERIVVVPRGMLHYQLLRFCVVI